VKAGICSKNKVKSAQLLRLPQLQVIEIRLLYSAQAAYQSLPKKDKQKLPKWPKAEKDFELRIYHEDLKKLLIYFRTAKASEKLLMALNLSKFSTFS